MRINVGKRNDDIRAETMQNTLNDLQRKIAPTVPVLVGALATELGVDENLASGANAHIKAEWKTYQSEMAQAVTPDRIRSIDQAFRKLEGI